MKNLILSIGLCSAALLSLGQQATGAEINYGTLTKTAAAPTNAEVIFAASLTANIRLLSLEVTNDSPVVGYVKYLGGTAVQKCTNGVASGVTNIPMADTSYFASNDIVVIQAPDLSSVFTAKVWGTNGTTNLLLTAATSVAVTNGARVYKLGDLFTNQIGATTFREDGPCIVSSRYKMPLVIWGNGTNAAIIIRHATVEWRELTSTVAIGGSK